MALRFLGRCKRSGVREQGRLHSPVNMRKTTESYTLKNGGFMMCELYHNNNNNNKWEKPILSHIPFRVKKFKKHQDVATQL